MQPNAPELPATFNAKDAQHSAALATLCELYGITDPVVQDDPRAMPHTYSGKWVLRGIYRDEADGRRVLRAVREEGNAFAMASVPLQWESDERRMIEHGEPASSLPGPRPDWFPTKYYAKAFALHVKRSPAWQALAPVVRVYWSDLGGAANLSVALLLVLDERCTWTNGIMENARHLRFSVGRAGVLRADLCFWHPPFAKLRQREVRNAEHLREVLAGYVAKCNAAKKGGDA